MNEHFWRDWLWLWLGLDLLPEGVIALWMIGALAVGVGEHRREEGFRVPFDIFWRGFPKISATNTKRTAVVKVPVGRNQNGCVWFWPGVFWQSEDLYRAATHDKEGGWLNMAYQLPCIRVP